MWRGQACLPEENLSHTTRLVQCKASGFQIPYQPKTEEWSVLAVDLAGESCHACRLSICKADCNLCSRNRTMRRLTVLGLYDV